MPQVHQLTQTRASPQKTLRKHSHLFRLFASVWRARSLSVTILSKRHVLIFIVRNVSFVCSMIRSSISLYFPLVAVECQSPLPVCTNSSALDSLSNTRKRSLSKMTHSEPFVQIALVLNISSQSVLTGTLADASVIARLALCASKWHTGVFHAPRTQAESRSSQKSKDGKNVPTAALSFS